MRNSIQGTGRFSWGTMTKGNITHVQVVFSLFIKHQVLQLDKKTNNKYCILVNMPFYIDYHYQMFQLCFYIVHNSLFASVNVLIYGIKAEI